MSCKTEGATHHNACECREEYVKGLEVRLEIAEKLCAIVAGPECRTTSEWIQLIAPAAEAWRKSKSNGNDAEYEK